METSWIKFLTFTHDIHINLEYGLGNFNKCVSTKFEHITISDFSPNLSNCQRTPCAFLRWTEAEGKTEGSHFQTLKSFFNNSKGPEDRKSVV